MNENVYFECRKRAAIHNERLNSRAGAAEILGISESTLAHYELGITKNIPVDVVVMMAEVYNAPELKCIYCKSECPIGKELPIATEAGNIEELYEDIRKDAEKQGYSMTDRKFTELVQYAERKAAVAGKDESYIPYLLPDVIKEYFIRNAINEVSTGMMEFERYIKTQKQEVTDDGRNDRKTVAFRGAEFDYQGINYPQSSIASRI